MRPFLISVSLLTLLSAGGLSAQEKTLLVSTTEFVKICPDCLVFKTQCGNGVWEEKTEQCDTSDPSYMTPSGFACVDCELFFIPFCDPGSTTCIPPTDPCILFPSLCIPPECGDGDLDPGETCDPAMFTKTACRSNCTYCGDGNWDEGFEQCDGTEFMPSAPPDATCNPLGDCTLDFCGNGVIEPGEECDDLNTSNTDACVGVCQNATCGDGYVHAGVEACDDGNMVDTDACRNDCTLPSCGDGIIDPGEECDDGNLIPDDGCTSCMTDPFCGDGTIDPGEECDDGNAADGDSCSSTCTFDTALCNPPYPVCWTHVEFGADDIISNDKALGIAVDSEGNVIVVGQTDSPDDPVIGRLLFVRKLNPCGDPIWTDQTTVAMEEDSPLSKEFATNVAVDAMNNIYVTGIWQNPIGIWGDWLGTAFTRMYSSSGEIMWTMLEPGAGGSGIAVDSAGNVFVVGSYTFFGGYDPWLVKYATSDFGSPSVACWEVVPTPDSSPWSPAPIHAYLDVALDASDAPYVVGAGPGEGYDSLWERSIWVRKYNNEAGCPLDVTFGSSGELFFDTGGDDAGLGVAINSLGNLAVSGYTERSIELSFSAGNIWVQNFNGIGATVWDSPLILGGPYDDIGKDVTMDDEGNVYVAGNYSIAPPSTGTSSSSAWFSKIDSEGTLVWEQSFADVGFGTGNAYAEGIALDASDSIYIAGFISGPAGDVSAGHLFVRKYPPDGICPAP